jgi:hypothetical protein
MLRIMALPNAKQREHRKKNTRNRGRRMTRISQGVGLILYVRRTFSFDALVAGIQS